MKHALGGPLLLYGPEELLNYRKEETMKRNNDETILVSPFYVSGERARARAPRPCNYANGAA